MSSISIILRIQNNSSPVTRLGSNYILLLFFSWHPCRQGWVDHDFCFHCLFSSSHFSIDHYVLYQQSSIPLTCRSFSPLFSHSLFVSFTAIPPSRFWSSSSPFHVHVLGICSLRNFFYLSSFPHLLLTNFFLELSFTSTSALS